MRSDVCGYSTTERAQLSLALLEVALGVAFVFAVLLGVVLGIPTPDTRDAQLEIYASDIATVLASEAPHHQGQTRLSELTQSPSAFEQENGNENERNRLKHRIDRLLPDNLMFRIETPHGAVGYRIPSGVSLGTATVPTINGDVTIIVWYI